MVWGLVPIAYLLGTFPSAVMVARSKGVDITAVGSRNPGASNVARTLGTAWGVLVFVLDGLKGAIPALVGLALDEPKATYVLVAAAVLGHMYPVTRRFVGGKGVATVGGAMVVLHLVVFLVLLAIWVAVRKLSGKASLGSLAIALGLPIGVALDGSPAWEVVATTALAALVLLRHSDNIKRLAQGRELSASRRS
ncbi:MAG: glycerol-3-phosphate 1-O-acyltransferase PlsY [Acidimicrobiales bacterium]|nr:glycerol-3-phosphate 1-O-acyltransferase PlsY [Acidimicrobiales bacterium]MCB9392452.1 glycerol-3-phosphate 1-O-acyltransferase PlsY [Acidimicrobiaceae bacterium]